MSHDVGQTVADGQELKVVVRSERVDPVRVIGNACVEDPQQRSSVVEHSEHDRWGVLAVAGYDELSFVEDECRRLGARDDVDAREPVDSGGGASGCRGELGNDGPVGSWLSVMPSPVEPLFSVLLGTL